LWKEGKQSGAEALHFRGGLMMRMKSAVGFSYKLMLYALTLLAAGVLMNAAAGNLPLENVVATYAAVMAMEALLLWVCFGSYYELREDCIYCRSGPFVEKIRYEQIQSARLCEKSVSSMALSGRCIEIRRDCKRYLLGITMISPVRREEFLRHLLSRCGNLQVQADDHLTEGDAYVRTVLYPRG
jgi:hypothetical protein